MSRIASAVLIALFLGSIVVASDSGSGPRIYTNQDLAPAGSRAQEPAFYDTAYVEALEPFPVTGVERVCSQEASCDDEDRAFVGEFLAVRREPATDDNRIQEQPAQPAEQPTRDRWVIGTINGVPIPCVYGNVGPPWCDRRPRARRRDAARPSPEPRQAVPHQRFIDKPPVREHTPGLGDHYRRARPQSPSRP